MRKSVVVTSALVLTLLATAGNPAFLGRWSPVYAKPHSVASEFAPGEIIVKLKSSPAPGADDAADEAARIEAVNRSAAAIASRAGAGIAEPLFQRTWSDRLGP